MRHVTRKGEITNTNTAPILFGKLEGEIPFGKARRRYEDDIKT